MTAPTPIDILGGTDARRANPLREVAAACALGIAGYGFYQALPVMLGMLAQHHGLTVQQIGWLGSLELSGMLLGGLFAAWSLPTFRQRRLGGGALTSILIALACTLAATSFGATSVARFAGGFGAGLAYSISVASVALTAAPTRNFGVLNAAMVLSGSIQLSAFPWVGMTGSFMVLAVECVVAALLLPALPVAQTRPRRDARQRAGAKGIQGWTFLAATTLFHIAPAALWTYSERIGTDSGLTAGFVGATLTMSTLAAAGTCLLGWRLGARWGEHRALLGTAALLALTLTSWLAPSFGAAGYALRSLFFFSTWALGGVFQLSAAEPVDSSGRLAALVPVAQNVGLAIGPLAGASVLTWGVSLPDMLAVNAAFVVLSLLLYVVVAAMGHQRLKVTPA